MSSDDGIEVTALLCDAAQAVGGKLYILGAGWSRILKVRPLTMAVAVKLAIPWTSANRRLRFAIGLFDEDGRAVPGPSMEPVRAQGEVEVGRPAGLRPGTSLDSSFAIPIEGLDLAPGVYRWEVSIDNDVRQVLPFEVVAPGPS